MSWNFLVEFSVPPSTSGISRLYEAIFDKASFAKGLYGASLAEEYAHIQSQQIDCAVEAAIELCRRERTYYPTGCNVTIDCDGHFGRDSLNFEPHHVCVRMTVIPVPISR